MLTLLAIAHATPGPEFELLKQVGDCTFRKREKTEERGAAMWASCTWSEVDPARARQLITDLDNYEDLIWPISESRVERAEAGRQLVYQRQHIWALSDREVLLWVSVDDRPEQALVRWEVADELPLELSDGAIRTPVNTGFWRVEPNPDGAGTVVTHQIEVQAGGLALPQWLIRAIQTRGFNRILSDVRELAQQATK